MALLKIFQFRSLGYEGIYKCQVHHINLWNGSALFLKKLHLPDPNILQLLACESVTYMVSFVLLLLQCFEDVLKNLKNVLS